MAAVAPCDLVAPTERTVSLFAPMIMDASIAKEIKAASCCESAMSACIDRRGLLGSAPLHDVTKGRGS